MKPDIQTFPATTRLGRRFFVLGTDFSAWGWGFGLVPGVGPSSGGEGSIKIHGYVPPIWITESTLTKKVLFAKYRRPYKRDPWISIA